MTWSAEAFRRLVWPVLEEHYPGRLVQMETVATRTFARELDMLAGIDALYIEDGVGIRGIASRMQACIDNEGNWIRGCPYNSFTVRRSTASGGMTEYAKRQRALASGGELLYPHLTVQGYVTDKSIQSELLTFAVALTRDVIGKIDEWERLEQPYGTSVHINEPKNRDATFYVVLWRAVSCQMRHTVGDRSI